VDVDNTEATAGRERLTVTTDTIVTSTGADRVGIEFAGMYPKVQLNGPAQ
jgi:hypothetical protein